MGCENSGNQLKNVDNFQSNQPLAKSGVVPKQFKGYDAKRVPINERVTLQSAISQKVRRLQFQMTGNDIVAIQNALENHFLFYRMAPADRSLLIHYMKCYSAEKGTYIIEKGDCPNLFLVIMEGAVDVEVDGLKIKSLGKCDTIGDHSIIYETERSASFYARTECKFWGVSKTIFRKFLKEMIRKNYKETRMYVRKISLFGFISSAEKDAIATKMHTLKFEAGESIFVKGEVANAFFVVIKGEVGLVVPAKDRIIVRAGDAFGESALNLREKRFGDAICLENALLLSISRQAINDCLGGNFNSIIHHSVIKWSLRRAPVFSQLSNVLIDKIVFQGKIKKCEEGSIICTKGEQYPCLIICLEGKVNGEGVGTVFNHEFENIEQRSLKTSLIKDDRGAIFQIAFHRLNYIVGNTLNSRKYAFENRIALSGFSQKQSTRVKLEDLCMIKKISEGQSHSKYIVHDPNKTGRLYTMKVVSKNMVVQYEIEHCILEEKRVWEELNSSFVTKLHETYQDDCYVYFLSSFECNGSLENALQQIRLCCRSFARFYMGCIVLCLEELHASNIVHRDINPESLLIDAHGYLVLGDVSTAKKLIGPNQKTFTLIGTPRYMAPEIVEGKGYGFAVDLWSIGIILYEMVCGFSPFECEAENSLEIYCEILRDSALEFPNNYRDQTGKELIAKLLQSNPLNRSEGSFEELREMSFFKGFNWDYLLLRLTKSPFFPKAESYHQMRNFKTTPLVEELRREKPNCGHRIVSERYPDWDLQF